MGGVTDTAGKAVGGESLSYPSNRKTSTNPTTQVSLKQLATLVCPLFHTNYPPCYYSPTPQLKPLIVSGVGETAGNTTKGATDTVGNTAKGAGGAVQDTTGGVTNTVTEATGQQQTGQNPLGLS